MQSALFAILLLPVAAFAQERDSTVSVSMSRTSRVIPDRAAMYVVVEGSAETPADATGRVDVKVKAITEALKALAGRVEFERPFAYTLSPAIRDQSYPNSVATPLHTARSVIHVQINKPDELVTVIAAVMAAGASTVSTITFESSTADSVRRARIKDAVAAAKADAEAVASAMGGRLGAVLEVNASGGYGYQGSTQINFDARYPNNQVTAPEIMVTASVTVRYRLIH